MISNFRYKTKKGFYRIKKKHMEGFEELLRINKKEMSAELIREVEKLNSCYNNMGKKANDVKLVVDSLNEVFVRRKVKFESEQELINFYKYINALL